MQFLSRTPKLSSCSDVSGTPSSTTSSTPRRLSRATKDVNLAAQAASRPVVPQRPGLLRRVATSVLECGGRIVRSRGRAANLGSAIACSNTPVIIHAPRMPGAEVHEHGLATRVHEHPQETRIHVHAGADDLQQEPMALQSLPVAPPADMTPDEMLARRLESHKRLRHTYVEFPRQRPVDANLRKALLGEHPASLRNTRVCPEFLRLSDPGDFGRNVVQMANYADQKKGPAVAWIHEGDGFMALVASAGSQGSVRWDLLDALSNDPGAKSAHALLYARLQDSGVHLKDIEVHELATGGGRDPVGLVCTMLTHLDAQVPLTNAREVIRAQDVIEV